MSVLNKLASFQGRQDDVPNQELSRALAAKKDEIPSSLSLQPIASRSRRLNSIVGHVIAV